MKHNRFKKYSAVFECCNCHKSTRDTGHNEAALELCKKCLFGFYVKNALSDYGKNSDEYKKAMENFCNLK